ncbi:hypothetical protein LINPERPRIM_LOCUS26456 [Linum perenne]
MRAESRVLSEVVNRRRETLLRWIPAPDEWVTVNCDGFVTQPHGLAATGGIISNNHGRRLAVFAANLGICTIMRAELRAAALTALAFQCFLHNLFSNSQSHYLNFSNFNKEKIIT